MNMRQSFPLGAMLDVLLLFSYVTAATADAAAYFSKLTNDTNWMSAQSSSFPRYAFMPSEGNPEDGAAVFWSVDNDRVHFALAVKALGWVGFGISEAGGMLGADMALYKTSNPSNLVDAYVIEGRSMPLTDDCQDWTLEGATSENGWLIVEMSRLLDTNDGQDRAIKHDADLWVPPTRIIAAWGDTDMVSYHGEKKARSSIRIFADHSNELTEMQALLKTLEEESDSHFDFLEDKFSIPAKETHYQNLCKTVNHFNIELPQGRSVITIIGAMPIITGETAEFIHHFIVYAQKDCTDESTLTRSMIYGWAPGDEGWALPNDVGFPLFDDVNNQALHLEIHYNNPYLIEDMKDSSGVRLYYTYAERTHRAGVLAVGDPYLSLYGESIGEGLTQYAFTCPGACTSSLLGKERNGNNQGITVVSEHLHMHKTGARMTSEVIRGDEVFHKAVADVYEFDQQGAFHVPQDFYTVLPGDSFRTTCYYKDGTAFGLSSQEEMCINFVLYYPAKKTADGKSWTCPYNPEDDFGAGCAAELDMNVVGDLGRDFGNSSGKCVKPAIEALTGSETGQLSSATNEKRVTLFFLLLVMFV